MALTFFINRKSEIIVVSMTGAISPEDVEVFQKCIDEMKLSSPKWIILNLGAVISISKDSLRSFTIFQQNLREISKLVVCSIEETLLKSLKADGVIRDIETQPDLMSALKMILTSEQ